MIFNSIAKRFLRIPQIYRDQKVAGAIPIKDWDDGIPAAWSSYYISGNRQQVNGENDNSNWASLNSGLNLGAGGFVIQVPTAIRMAGMRSALRWSGILNFCKVSLRLARHIPTANCLTAYR